MTGRGNHSDELTLTAVLAGLGFVTDRCAGGVRYFCFVVMAGCRSFFGFKNRFADRTFLVTASRTHTSRLAVNNPIRRRMTGHGNQFDELTFAAVLASICLVSDRGAGSCSCLRFEIMTQGFGRFNFKHSLAYRTFRVSAATGGTAFRHIGYPFRGLMSGRRNFLGVGLSAFAAKKLFAGCGTGCRRDDCFGIGMLMRYVRIKVQRAPLNHIVCRVDRDRLPVVLASGIINLREARYTRKGILLD